MMIQIETGYETGNKYSAKNSRLERSASFSSPSIQTNDDSSVKSSTRPSPIKQASFSAIVNVSKMQASFAERTATEMEEIVSWYEKYEGIERLKEENQQIQSMPYNAMIVVEDEVDGGDAFGEEKNSATNTTSADKQDDQQRKTLVGDAEYAIVKDYHISVQRNKITTPMTSRKKATSLMFSAIRSISKTRKCDDSPPRAIKIQSEDEDESVITSLSPRHNADDSMKRVNKSSADAVSGDLIREHQNEEEIIPYRDEEEKVLAMLSPSGCAKLKVQTLFENVDVYIDEEQEVLKLLSPVSCSSKSFLSSSRTENSAEDMSNNSKSFISTGEEAQSQIKAAANLIRNTQDMAEIILQLQQSSSFASNDDGDDDDDDIVNIYSNNVNQDNNSIPTLSVSLSSAQYGSDIDSHDAASFDETNQTLETKKTRMHDKLGTENRFIKGFISKASITSSKAAMPSGFQVEQFYRFIVPLLLSFVIGLIFKFLKQ